MEESFIVVEAAGQTNADGTRLREGTVVDAATERKLTAKKALLLPFALPLAKLSGVGGYQRRHWGNGVDLDGITPRLACGLTLYLSAGQEVPLHWLALLEPSRQVLELMRAGKKPISGKVQLAGDQSQAVASKLQTSGDGGMKQLETLGMGDYREDLGGFVVGGATKARVMMDGHYGLGIYGMGKGLRVVWAAAAQARMVESPK